MREVGQAIGAEVRQRMTLEPRPQVFDRVQFGSIGRQEADLDMAVGGVDIVAHQSTVVTPGTVPQNQQRLAKVRFEGIEEFYNLLLFDRSFVYLKAHATQMHAGVSAPVLPELHAGSQLAGAPCDPAHGSRLNHA